jgi:hypothetical protein
VKLKSNVELEHIKLDVPTVEMFKQEEQSLIKLTEPKIIMHIRV